jgi:hypothetical protein
VNTGYYQQWNSGAVSDSWREALGARVSCKITFDAYFEDEQYEMARRSNLTLAISFDEV